MPHASLLFDSGLLGEPLPIKGSFAGVGIYREVSDLEGAQVLKEMASLRWRHPKVAESGLDDRACAGDFVPIDRNPHPRIVRSPAPDSDQQVRTVFCAQNSVEARHGVGDLTAAAALKALRIDDHDIVQILNSPVAENLGAPADQFTWLDVSHRQVFLIARHRERTNLQKSELGRLLSLG